jgi:hypothetical protein
MRNARFSCMLATLGLALALSLSAMPANAAGQVTLCDTDIDIIGGGLNLRDALAGGGLVTFACKPGTSITVTMTHKVAGDAAVDGGGSVALKTNSVRAMFLVEGRLQLRGLTLGNPFTGLSTTPVPGGIGVGPGVITLDDSHVRDSSNPFQVDTIRVGTSSFEHNHGFSIIEARVAILFRSTFTDNNAVVLRSGKTPEPGRPSVAVIDESTFSRNQSAVWWAGELHVSKSSFTDHDNKGRPGGALHVHGATAIDHSSFDRNHAASGGAIWMEAGTLTLRRAVFHDNVAQADGGAIGLGETGENNLVSQYGTFEGNSAVRGGAVKMGTPGAKTALQGGPNTFVRNKATLGGAVYSEFGGMQLVRAVFTDNAAATEGGAVYASRLGSPRPAVFANSLLVRNAAPDGSAVSGSAVTLINSSVTSNQGIAVSLKPLSHFSDPSARGVLDLRNALVSSNSGGNCTVLPAGFSLRHNGHSLQFPDVRCGVAVRSADPLLGPFYVPQSGSPAFDGGDNAMCVDAPISGKDIYSARRPQGKFCAIGAVEGELDPRVVLSLTERVRDWTRRSYASVLWLLKH